MKKKTGKLRNEKKIRRKSERKKPKKIIHNILFNLDEVIKINATNTKANAMFLKQRIRS